MKLSALKEAHQTLKTNDQNIRVFKNKYAPSTTKIAALLGGLLVQGISFAEPVGAFWGHHSGEQMNIPFINQIDGEFSSPRCGEHECNIFSQGLGDGIEFFTPVSVYSKPVPEPGAEDKGDNRPDKCSKGHKRGVSTTEGPKLAEENAHGGEIVLFSLIAATLFNFCCGAYLGLRAACRHDYARRNSAGKAPVIGLLSALIIPRKIKNRRWQIWEQRQWFRDLRLSHGIEVAYRDARYWKRLVTERRG